MSEALKEIFNLARIREIALELEAVYPQARADRFVSLAADGLDGLSIMQRMRRIAETFGHVLPASYGDSLAILRELLPRLGTGFPTLIFPEYVAVHGLDHFDLSMDALRDFTASGSSEFAVRPFLRRDFPRAIAVMRTWARAESEHVRRLASEGSRPRLPWSFQLTEVIADPSLTAPILEALRADPSPYVRRSVANHWNDLAKDHPGWVVQQLEAWPQDNPATAWITKHALRTLVKKGDARALGLIGATGEPKVTVEEFSVSPERIRLGEPVRYLVRLVSTSRKEQRLVVDYAIHYVKTSGGTSRKVFKLRELRLGARERAEMTLVQMVKDFTTRKHYAGRHVVELLVNGQPMGECVFDLAME
ncbi:MAG TPA: hypothetical protein VFQ91_13040 [Bryobacteraceae bacterium]|nr:hypothetical protein [Bryobacteraceae bacterium]